MPEPLLVRACRREQVERTPVWFMRQAGRSLPEYRALRERHGFFELAGTPELCAEVTLQPVQRYGVDAAVLFADIMTPVLAMGIDVQLVEGVGPMLEHPIRTAADVERLRPTRAARGDAGGHSPRALGAAPDKALVGFCGAPFTVACYLVEGRGSRDFLAAKELMYREPAVWHALLERLADELRRLRQGAGRGRRRRDPALRFMGGHPQPGRLRGFAAPYSRRVLEAVDVPAIHFGTGTAGLLAHMRDAGGDVIGLDWRVELDRGWASVGLDLRRPGQP